MVTSGFMSEATRYMLRSNGSFWVVFVFGGGYFVAWIGCGRIYSTCLPFFPFVVFWYVVLYTLLLMEEFWSDSISIFYSLFFFFEASKECNAGIYQVYTKGVRTPCQLYFIFCFEQNSILPPRYGIHTICTWFVTVLCVLTCFKKRTKNKR